MTGNNTLRSEIDPTMLICVWCGAENLSPQNNMLRCCVCDRSAAIRDGKVYFANPPADAAVNNDANALDQSRWTPLRHAQFAFLKENLCNIDSKAIICDCGAGPGQFKTLFERFSRILAVDFYPYSSVNVVADLEKRMPFRSETFDVVVSMNTFEHIHKVVNLLAECQRILKKGGILMGSTPFLLGIHQPPYDFHRFTHFELQKLFTEAGFTNIEVEPLATTFDWYRTSELHFFMKLFDATQKQNGLLKRWLAYGAVKFLWNLKKLLMIVCAPLYRLNRDSSHTLGYGFVAFKAK